MSPQESHNRRRDTDESPLISGGTDRLPPYAGPGNEPSDQVADDSISAADHRGERAQSDITSDDVTILGSEQRPIPGRTERLTDPLKPVYAAYPDPEAAIDASTGETGTDDRAPLETFTEKDGGTPLPASVPRDPVSPGVGPLSRAIVAIIVLVLLLILIAVVVSLI
jgi:hypothetical protein